MHKYTHAWLAFRAIQRLENVKYNMADEEQKKIINNLIIWFMDHKDGVIKGAWYPDEIIKDNSKSHVMKYKPDPTGTSEFRSLPSTYEIYKRGKTSGLYNQPYLWDKNTNLPN